MLEGIINLGFKLLFPRAPAWIAVLLSAAVPAVIDLVEDLADMDDLTGPEKFEFVVSNVRKFLDDGFDEIPEWSAYPEDKRDLIIGGMTELAYFIHKVAESGGKKLAKRGLRRSVRKMRRRLRARAKAQEE